MKKRIIIGILIAALVAGGSAGGAVYYKKSHQKTVSVVSVDNLAGQYYMDDTNLDGNIVTSAIQNITVDKDMIIQEVYVSKDDEVKKDDKLISFDMTLVQMELNIAKLKQQQQEQDLNKAINRLNSLKNGGAIEESDADTSTPTDSDTDKDSSMNGTDSADTGDEYVSASGNVNGAYLAAVMNPVLAAAVNAEDVSDVATYQAETSAESDSTQSGDTGTPTGESGSIAASEDAGEDTGGDNTGGDNTGDTNGDTGGNSGTDSSDDNSDNGDQIDIIDGGDSGDSNSSDDNTGDSFGDGSDDQIEIVDSDEGSDKEVPDMTDGDPTFYQILDNNTEPLTGKGTKEDPYVFLCSSAKGYVIVRGSFLNKMAAFDANGNKEAGKNGYWYQLEFHQNDTVEDLGDRKKSCTGYYLIDGSLLEKMVPDYSEVEFTLEDASHYDNSSDDDDGNDGGYDGDQGDGGSTSISREDAIKIQQNKIDSLKLDIRESKLNIEKLEKKVKKEVIYSKLDGTVAKVGDPATAASDGNTFMTIKSKEGFYVKGTVSELMLDQVKEGTILNCSGQSGDFEAEVVDVSEYPVSGDSYSGSGNPNVSYYSYTATIPDKSVKVSDADWLTITLKSDAQSKGIVLDRAFVRSENGSSYVYKDDNGVLKKQKLSVGGNVNGGYSVLVTGGITRDDKIAFPYGDTVKEGAKTQEVSVNELYGY